MDSSNVHFRRRAFGGSAAGVTIANLTVTQYAVANCNINANFWDNFLLKLQKEWRIGPEK